MPWLDRPRLAAEILVAYGEAKLRMRDQDLPATLRALRRNGAGGAVLDAGSAEAARLGRAVVRTLTLLPTDSRCLIRSLVLCRLLDRRGIPCTLVIGVRHETTFEAHAWVEVSGRPVLMSGGDAVARLVDL